VTDSVVMKLKVSLCDRLCNNEVESVVV
jgi:hypothetical protein